MKRVIPNLIDILTTRYISNLSRLRRFARYWGKTTIDGVEVFTEKKYYYPDMDLSTEKIAKMLGAYNDVKKKPHGIRSAWFTLSAEKSKDSTIDWDRTILTNNFNRAFKEDLECSVVIGPKLVKKKQVPADITTSITNQAGIITEIQSKYQSLWDNDHTFFTGEDDPYLSLLATYILRSTDVPYEVVVVERTVASIYTPTVDAMDNVPKTDQVPAWRVRLFIPHYEFTASTDIIDLIVEDGTKSEPKTMDFMIQERVRSATLGATDEDGDDESTPDISYEALPITTDSFWHTAVSEGDTYSVARRYLKTSILTTPSLDTAEKLNYILSCIDTGYRKKKKKWYEIVIAIVIIVLAFWVAGPQGGQAAAKLIGLSQAFVAVVSVAITITIATLYISLAALAASLMGATNVSLALSQFLRAVSPLTRIASVIAFVATIYSAVKEAAKKMAEESAKKGVKDTLVEAAKDLAARGIESMTGLTKLSNMTMLHIIKMLSFTFDIYKDWNNRDLQRELNDYRKELAALAESDEKAKTSDVVKDLMASYPNVLANDWSYYAELYDRPYEWWATPYHTGNIQATTVNALWLNEPQNAILYNNSTGAS